MTTHFRLALFGLCVSSSLHAGQFVSLSLCSDRLLRELAQPEQIAAQSPYSTNPLMMLDKINHDRPTVEPHLSALLPYLSHTILLNESFYPQLAAQLRQLGVKVVALNDSPQTPDALFAQLRQLGELTGNHAQAEALIQRLRFANFALNLPLVDTLLLTDTGIAEDYPTYRILLNLLGLTPLKTSPSKDGFSLEKLLLAQPKQLLRLTDQIGYNAEAQWQHHPLWQHLFAQQPIATLPLKYTYCVDHGLWQGAERIWQQWQEK